MQDFQNDTVEALAQLLDQHQTTSAVVSALQDFFAPYNIDQDDQLIISAKDNGFDIENSGSGDGCTVGFHKGSWCTHPFDDSTADQLSQHETTAWNIISYMWWGDLEIIHQMAHHATHNISP